MKNILYLILLFPVFLQAQVVGQFGGVYDTAIWEIAGKEPCSEADTVLTAGFECEPEIPGCGEIVHYEGRPYYTIQIGQQCWFQNSLNVGTRIGGVNDQANNGVVEKYCYDNNEFNCFQYGGLYQWDEMMQYDSTAGAKGICPPGWHVPTAVEWDILAEQVGFYEFTGCHTKSTGTIEAGTGIWYYPNKGAQNSSRFFAHPGGIRNSFGTFNHIGYYFYAWTSDRDVPTNTSYCQELSYNSTWINRYKTGRMFGFSVRCLKDN